MHTESDQSQPASDGNDVTDLSRVQIFLLIQFTALLIGLALPITPSKTGSDRDIAEYFIENPTYLEKAFVAFLLTNLLILCLALIFWIYWIFRKKTDGVESEDPESESTESATGL